MCQMRMKNLTAAVSFLQRLLVNVSRAAQITSDIFHDVDRKFYYYCVRMRERLLRTACCCSAGFTPVGVGVLGNMHPLNTCVPA